MTDSLEEPLDDSQAFRISLGAAEDQMENRNNLQGDLPVACQMKVGVSDRLLLSRLIQERMKVTPNNGSIVQAIMVGLEIVCFDWPELFAGYDSYEKRFGM